MFKPGQKVVCLKNGDYIGVYRKALEVNKIYTWRRTDPWYKDRGTLEEVKNITGCGGESGYEMVNFRLATEADMLNVKGLMEEVNKLPKKQIKRELVPELVN